MFHATTERSPCGREKRVRLNTTTGPRAVLGSQRVRTYREVELIWTSPCRRGRCEPRTARGPVVVFRCARLALTINPWLLKPTSYIEGMNKFLCLSVAGSLLLLGCGGSKSS